jgi:sugar phosphate isomerase/epimerase
MNYFKEGLMERRTFLKLSAAAACGLSAGCQSSIQKAAVPVKRAKTFEISLAQWSLNKRLFGTAGDKLDNLDFAKTASELGFDAIEYVNAFFMKKALDVRYLAEMKKRARDNGVRSLLIMCDREGKLGDPDSSRRVQAIENHLKWLRAARFLGCHSIRVNAASEGTYNEQLKLATDGLSRLSERAKGFGLNVIVENHGGLSSDAKWLSSVMKKVNMPNCGTLPDFGNFPKEIDKYEAVDMLMPYAKSVSAKSYDFDENGNETSIDYYRMMDIVLGHGYDGYVGIEYEGNRLSEEEGIIATKQLLEKIRNGLADA